MLYMYKPRENTPNFKYSIIKIITIIQEVGTKFKKKLIIFLLKIFNQKPIQIK